MTQDQKKKKTRKKEKKGVGRQDPKVRSRFGQPRKIVHFSAPSGKITHSWWINSAMDFAGHDALRAKRKIAFGCRIAASPLADLEDSIRFGWPSRYFIQITIWWTVFPLIFPLDGQESEEEARDCCPLPCWGV
jgi:hypothetical protein